MYKTRSMQESKGWIDWLLCERDSVEVLAWPQPYLLSFLCVLTPTTSTCCQLNSAGGWRASHRSGRQRRARRKDNIDDVAQIFKTNETSSDNPTISHPVIPFVYQCNESVVISCVPNNLTKRHVVIPLVHQHSRTVVISRDNSIPRTAASSSSCLSALS
jgi:hypothetical protein